MDTLGIDRNFKATELRLPDIKLYLSDTVGRIIQDTGFKFKKTDFSYKRRNSLGYQIFHFLFYNYFPVHYSFHFLFEIWNNDIEKVKSAFPFRHQSAEKFDFRTLMIPMGEYIPEEQVIFLENKYLKNLDSGKLTYAQIAGYACELRNDSDLSKAADLVGDILIKQVLPLSENLLSVDDIDVFFAQKAGWSVTSLSLNNIASDLVAAKLNRKRNFSKVFDEINEALVFKIENDGAGDTYKKIIEDLFVFLQKNY